MADFVKRQAQLREAEAAKREKKLQERKAREDAAQSRNKARQDLGEPSPFVCPYCPEENKKDYAGKPGALRALNQHIKNEHPRESKVSIFKCQFPGCPKMFRDGALLKNHSKTHENQDEEEGLVEE